MVSKESDSARKLLLVEDSKSLARMVADKIESRLAIKVDVAGTFAEAVTLIAKKGDDYFLSILDLTLPDASGNEVVDYVLTRNIPVIVFAGKYNRQLQETLWGKMIVDYVLKENPNNIDYLISVVRRISKNKDIKVLVVDDSKSARLEMCNLLTIHQYDVYYASNGIEAVEIIKDITDIKLILTDYYMPKMSGLQLTKYIRRHFAKNELAILGISSRGNTTMSAQFIKNGANDFLSKPFSSEELYCRVNQNVDLLEYIHQITESSNRDYLTGLFNRRYFFEMGRKLVASARRGHIELGVALFDIDFFKNVNDTYGHDAGDIVLKELSLILQNRFRETDVVCRYGGEEIAVMVVNMNQENVFEIFECLRKKVETTPIDIGSMQTFITVSVGICAEPKETLEEMISIADEKLYAAKEGGRNQTQIHPAS